MTARARHQRRNSHGIGVLALALVFSLSSFAPRARSQTPKMTTILYGASYYHEYMPYERLDKDVQMMKEAGLNVVRLGESTWTNWEPREGEFEFVWMERILDRMNQAGVKAILGTPTYSIPPWLFRKHPEILVTGLGGVRSFYGPRQNMDITHPTYLYYAERAIRRIVVHFRNHPAIIGYQIDNETASYGTAGANVQAGFVDYLKSRFQSTARLNQIWGLAYWGQLLNGWEEFPPRDGILNPGYKLEWERYQQKIVTDFLAWQARIVNEYKRPDQFITQNFVGGVRTNIDEFEIAKHLDIAGVNPYHPVQDELDGSGIALSGDLCRSLKQSNYLITETNAQTTGWDSKAQFPPFDGQLRLNVYSHISSGANMVAYWHWHSLHYGQETYWKGVLSHDLEPNRAYREISRVAHELQRVGPELVNLQKSNRIAVLYSIDSCNGIQFMPFDNTVDYLWLLHQLHRTLFKLNAGVDFVFPQSADFSRYQVIVVPPLYVASDNLLEKLTRFAANGGHLLLLPKSGFCDEYSTVRWTRAPGSLREAAGFSYQEFTTLKQEIALKGDPFGVGDGNRVSVWAELIVPENAKALAYYDHPFLGKYPAITRNQFGKGTVTYEGTVLSDQIQAKVVADVMNLAGLVGPDQQLPPEVRLKSGLNAAGKNIRFYLNYSGRSQSFTYPYEAGFELLTQKPIAKSAPITLAPWDLTIIREK